MDQPGQIVHNEAQQRFELSIGGQLARADYRLVDGVIHMVHTEVPRQYEGRGLAARLVRAAIAHARANGYKMRPACSYVRTYFARHQQDEDVLA